MLTFGEIRGRSRHSARNHLVSALMKTLHAATAGSALLLGLFTTPATAAASEEPQAELVRTICMEPGPNRPEFPNGWVLADYYVSQGHTFTITEDTQVVTRVPLDDRPYTPFAFAVAATSPTQTGIFKAESEGQVLDDTTYDVGRCYQRQAALPTTKLTQLNHLVPGQDNVKVRIDVTASPRNVGRIAYLLESSAPGIYTGFEYLAPGKSLSSASDPLGAGDYTCAVTRRGFPQSRACDFTVAPTPGVTVRGSVERLSGTRTLRAKLNPQTNVPLQYRVVQRNAAGAEVEAVKRTLRPGQVKTVDFTQVPSGHSVTVYSQSATIASRTMP